MARIAKYEVYLNRRISGYFIPSEGCFTLLYFSEDCPAISTVPLLNNPNTSPLSTEWLINTLKGTDQAVLATYAQEPIGIMLKIVMGLLTCVCYCIPSANFS